jgi:hypothetical protein
MQRLNEFYVYSYEHDDELLGWIPIEQFKFPVWRRGPDKLEEGNTPEFRKRLTETLKACGWEGDGRLGAMMLPPWLGSLTGWFPVFHVKQSNNGTSWIASERELTLEDLN